MTTVEFVGLQTFGKYLTYSLKGKSKTGITTIWEISNTDDGSILGEVRWNRSWRQYCFYQNPEIVMSASCLIEIADFLQRQTKEQRK